MSKDLNHPRGIASATYSGLAVVGLAAIALVSAAGAQPAQASGGQPSAARPTPAAAQGEQAAPPSGTRAESRRLARRLLARVVLPAGARVYHGKHVPAPLRGPAGEIVADHSVDVHKVFAERQSLRRTFEFLTHHHPAGLSSDGTGETYKLEHGRRVVLEEDVTYVPDRIGRDFSAIAVTVEVTSTARGHSMSRADVQVLWYPPRSAAEHLTARDFRAVRIHAWIYGKNESQVTRTFRQQAIIGKLARVLNSRPASPGGWESCPLITETYELTFVPVRSHAEVTVDVSGCFEYDVTVAGHVEPALVDNGSVEHIAHHLLRRHTPTNPDTPAPPPAG
jgi:hypothetical protein